MTYAEGTNSTNRRYEVIEGPDPDPEQRWDVAVCYSWLLDGVLHRPRGLPAREIYDDTDERFELVGQEWWQNGKRHRDNGPALIELYPDRRKEAWYQNGVLHRVDGPAVVDYDILDGHRLVSIEEWWLEGKRHRSGGLPAKTYREAPHGVISYQAWYEDGVPHRLDGPAMEDRDEETGILMTAQYWRNGVVHRADGPAEISYDARTGAVSEELFFLNGNQMDKDAFAIALRLD